MQQDEAHLHDLAAMVPGIDLEPLDPFFDDVFAGMDEHPPGPWAHAHLMPQHDADEQQEQQHSDNAHFPVIDCDLLGDDAAAVTQLQHSQVLQQQHEEGVAPADVASTGQHEPGGSSAVQPGSAATLELPEPPAGLHDLEGGAAAGAEADADLHETLASSATGFAAAAEQQDPLAASVSHQQQHEEQGVNDQAGGEAVRPCSSSSMTTAAEEEDDSASAGPADACSPAAANAAAAPEPPAAAADADAVDDDAAAAEAAAPPAGVEAEPSSGSLPDIDDELPAEQAGLITAAAGRQQSAGEEQEEEQLGGDGAPEAAGAAAAAGGGAAGDVDGQPQADGASSSSHQEQHQQAGGSDGGSQEGMDQQQQLSVDAEDFASPCSSWHSCVTAASKASSMMNSSRGFLVQQPTVAAAAAAAAAAGGVMAAGEGVRSSRSGVSSPALVSSLHLALQESQSQSHHSDSLAASLALADPLSAAAPDSPLAHSRAEEAPAGAAVAAADAGGSDGAGDDDGGGFAGFASQPIATHSHHSDHDQQQQQQKDEQPWQSVSPPSFSSSPGLLVCAAAAAAAAASAAAQRHSGEQTPAASSAAGANEQGTTGSQEEEQQQEAEGGAAGPDPTAAAAADGHAAAADADVDADADDAEPYDEDDDDVGDGHFYAVASGLSMSPDEHGGYMQQRPHGFSMQQQQHNMANMGASSYMLRQSELVDLSLSTSVHPSQLQHAAGQQHHPGWLTAHQQLPPAAAQAVERAVVALNDSYCYTGRDNSPSELLGAAAGAGGSSSSGAVRGIGVSAAMGAVGGAIRRSGAAQRWNRAHTQPQQDQQARHRLPSAAAHNGPGGPFGWPGAAVLGDWFSSTVQQPLAAVASRAAVGVGHRLGMAPQGQQQQQQQLQAQGGFARQNSGSGSSRGNAGITTGGSSSAAGDAAGTAPAAACPTAADAAVVVPSSEDSASSVEDAVLVEKTSDLPQSLQEQEDEAFRGLLFLGGRDSQGRPVVIINTDAIPAGHNSAPRDAALAYLLKRLSPVVMRGPYVLVIVALHHGPSFRLLPGVWCVRAYQSLPRAFHKNVKHVILLEPSLLVKTAVTLLYPFVSSKAHGKVKQVQRLLDIDVATCGEVQVPHLGEDFLTTIHHINSSRAAQEAAAAAAAANAPQGQR